MDDEQKKAHTKQMNASANKTQAEADEIRVRNGWQRFWLGISYVASYGAAFLIGIVVGIVMRFS